MSKEKLHRLVIKDMKEINKKRKLLNDLTTEEKKKQLQIQGTNFPLKTQNLILGGKRRRRKSRKRRRKRRRKTKKRRKRRKTKRKGRRKTKKRRKRKTRRKRVGGGEGDECEKSTESDYKKCIQAVNAVKSAQEKAVKSTVDDTLQSTIPCGDEFGGSTSGR